MMEAAETFHPAEFVRDELLARGWTTDHLVNVAGGTVRDLLALDIYLILQKPGCLLGNLDKVMALGFDTSSEMWRNLDVAWRAAPERSDYAEMPDEIFGVVSRTYLDNMFST